MCLGSHAWRTKNIRCIQRVFGLALFKSEEYTLHLAILGSHTYRSLEMAYRSTVHFSICSLQMEHRSAASFSIGTNGTNGTNRQIVYARPSGVNICSLQMERRSAASFSIGAIGTNGSIGEGFLTIGICLCVLDMCEERTL